MSASPRLGGLWAALKNNADHQMAFNRVIGGLVAAGYNLWAAPRGLMSGHPLLAGYLYVLFGVLIVLDLCLRPAGSARLRRFVALVVDIIALSYELRIGGGATVWMFPTYLWVIFGNGFRFGPQLLLVAMGLSIGGFFTIAAGTPFWSAYPALIGGLVVWLIVLPLYALMLINSLSKAQHEAEQASHAKSLFLASVSHELRTPLNAIIGMGALLEHSKLDPEQVEMSQTIMTSARALLMLINGILDLSRVEAGRLPVKQDAFDLIGILSEIRTIFLSQARTKGVRLNVHTAAGLPSLLLGDSGWVRQILLNLVGNAIKFTDHGNVTVAVGVVRQDAMRSRLRFEVVDTGIGIEPGALERIFETFTQADETISQRYGGTGLGLAITRKFVGLLGGEIGVQSAPGAGSTFWFELDFAVQSPAAAEPPHFAGLRAFALAAPPEAAPLLDLLAQWGVRVEHVDAAMPDCPEFTDPALSPAGGCILGFARQGPSAHARSYADLCKSGALSFVEIRSTPSAGLPAAPWRNAFVSALALPVDAGELANVLHFIDGGRTAAAAEAKAPAPARARYRILIADDNVTNQRVLKLILQSAGHAVRVAGDGEQALDALAEGGIDVAILDVNMPKVGGIDAAKIYRFSALGQQRVPLIALTADATPETRDRCLAAGMDACMVKPIEPSVMLASIDDIVGKLRPDLAGPAASVDTAGETAVNTRVTRIAAHPRFRPAVPALDADVLHRLSALGGEEFVVEIGEIFQSEARATLAELRAATEQHDVVAFRDRSHAIRSAATNIGATPLAKLCSPFETISGDALHGSGKAFLGQIEAELDRIGAALAERTVQQTERNLA